MTEPKKDEGHSIVDVIEEEPKKKGYTGKIIIGLVVVLIGLGSTLYWGKRGQVVESKNDVSGITAQTR